MSQSCQRVLQPEPAVVAAVTFAVPAVALLGLSVGPSQKSMMHSGPASGLAGSVAPFAIAAAAAAVHGLLLLTVLAAFVVPASVLISTVIAV